MQVKSEPIDIPKNESVKDKKALEASPSSGWAWPWGKPVEEKLDLSPENVKAQVTDPNVLHHIAAGERQQQLKRELKEKEDSEEGSEENSEESGDEESNDDFREQETKMTYCEKLEEYGEEIGYAIHKFKRSVELDLKNVYDDLIHAPQHIQLFLGAGLSAYLEIFPQAAIAFLTIMTVNGIVEAEVNKRLRERIRKTVLVEDKNVCTNLDDVDGDSDKCDDCDCDANSEEKECV